MARVRIYDTTLRDGAQTEGVSFSCEDKLDILSRLDDFGVDFVEGGWPGSNPRDDEFFERAGRMRLSKAALTAFGSTRRHGVPPEEDPNLAALASCSAEWCCIFGKSWDFHVTDALRIGLDDNLAMIEDSVRFLRESGKRVMFDAEHFFDGYFGNRDYALAALKAAERGGAEWLVLCDTNGGTLPTEVAAAVEDVLLSTDIPLGFCLFQHFAGRNHFVLLLADCRKNIPCRKCFVIQTHIPDDFLHNPFRIRSIVDGEASSIPHPLNIPPQNPAAARF